MDNHIEKKSATAGLIELAYAGTVPCKRCGAAGDIIDPAWKKGIGAELRKEGVSITFSGEVIPSFGGGYVHKHKDACGAKGTWEAELPPPVVVPWPPSQEGIGQLLGLINEGRTHALASAQKAAGKK